MHFSHTSYKPSERLVCDGSTVETLDASTRPAATSQQDIGAALSTLWLGNVPSFLFLLGNSIYIYMQRTLLELPCRSKERETFLLLDGELSWIRHLCSLLNDNLLLQVGRGEGVGSQQLCPKRVD